MNTAKATIKSVVNILAMHLGHYLCLAVYIWFSKKAIGFWGNKKMFEMTDIRKYNHAMSKLYVAHGTVFILLLNMIAILLLLLLIVCAILYWSTGVFYPISGVGFILFVIIVAVIQRVK